MMRYLITLLITAFLVGCSGPPQVDTTKIPLTEEELAYIASHPNVTWAAEDERPPYVLLKGGVYQGLSVAYMQIIEKKTGLKFKAIRTTTFSDSIDALETHKVDVMPAVRPTPSWTDKGMSFSSPFTYNAGVFIFRVNSLPRSPLTTGIRKSEAVKDYLITRFPDMRIVEVEDDEEAIAQLEKGLLDGVVMDAAAANFWIKQSDVGMRTATINFDYPYSFAYDKNNHVLGSILTKALNSISAKDKKAIDAYPYISEK